MFAPVRPIRGRWPAFVERGLRRYFWLDPAVLLEPKVTSQEFREAMSAVHVGGTIKITGTGRHPQADALAVDNLDLTGASIVDVGASDGSTSVDLISRIEGFAEYVIADLYMSITCRIVGSTTAFYGPDDECILVARPRWLAWPTLSRTVARLTGRFDRRARERDPDGREVLLLNPRARDLMDRDRRVRSAVHDVFSPWPDGEVDLIKVANLLRRLYFDDESIKRGLDAIHASLRTGGHLLVVDNSRIAGMPPRGGLYRKHATGFERIAATDNIPEIDDLVVAGAAQTTTT